VQVILENIAVEKEFNKLLFDTILDRLDKIGINFHSIKFDVVNYSIFGASYLPHCEKALIFYSRDLFWYKKHPEVFQVISEAINYDFEELSEDRQLFVFNTFAFLHELGHIKWRQKMWANYKKISDKPITAKMLIDNHNKHEKIYKKLKINHRDKIQERFCDRFASLVINEFMARGILKIF